MNVQKRSRTHRVALGAIGRESGRNSLAAVPYRTAASARALASGSGGSNAIRSMTEAGTETTTASASTGVPPAVTRTASGP